MIVEMIFNPEYLLEVSFVADGVIRPDRPNSKLPWSRSPSRDLGKLSVQRQSSKTKKIKHSCFDNEKSQYSFYL